VRLVYRSVFRAQLTLLLKEPTMAPKKAPKRRTKPSTSTKKPRTQKDVPGTVSQNFVPLKLNKRGNLGKYGKAMARKGGNRFKKPVSSVGDSYATKFEHGGSRRKEEGWGGNGVLLEEMEFEVGEVEVGEGVEVERRAVERPEWVVEEGGVLVSSVFYGSRGDADAEAKDKEVRVDLETALRESGLADGFRDGQREALEAVLGGESTLVVMPTGGLILRTRSIVTRIHSNSNSLTLVLVRIRKIPPLPTPNLHPLPPPSNLTLTHPRHHPNHLPHGRPAPPSPRRHPRRNHLLAARQRAAGRRGSVRGVGGCAVCDAGEGTE
jgi:hypothetical protein